MQNVTGYRPGEVFIKTDFIYIVKLQYLGFRFSGWAKNRDVKTVHQMIDKTLECILEGHRYKTTGCSRTDAMVSANTYIMQLMVECEIQCADFMEQFNLNLPPDIRVLSIHEAGHGFSVIKSVKEKEYIYLFTFCKRFHPFAAPVMAFFRDNLDIPLMQKGAKLFIGEHDFINYCTAPSPNVKSLRTITKSEIVENCEYSASFFPEKSYMYRVCSQGFMRNQVRLMVGQLVELGSGRLTLDELSLSLKQRKNAPFRTIAPASGLILNNIIMTPSM